MWWKLTLVVLNIGVIVGGTLAWVQVIMEVLP